MWRRCNKRVVVVGVGGKEEKSWWTDGPRVMDDAGLEVAHRAAVDGKKIKKRRGGVEEKKKDSGHRDRFRVRVKNEEDI